MSKTKAAGTTTLGRNARPKYLGVKLFAGEAAQPGSIIVRQHGNSFAPGKNVRQGADNTLYAIKKGVVKFVTKKLLKFDGSRRTAKIVSVESK